MDILDKIKNAIPTFTKSQRRIAAWILEDPLLMAFYSVDQSAREIGVSTATIVRFANSLGYSGYTQLQEEIKQYCQNQKSPIIRMQISQREFAKKDEMLDRIFQTQIMNLNRTYSSDIKEKIYETVEIIKNASRIIIVGTRGSSAIAYYLAHHLNRVLDKIHLIKDDSRIVEEIDNIKDGDVLFVVNMPRYNRILYRVASIAIRQGAKVVAITDSIASPYAQVSNVVLPAYHRSGDYHNSLLAAMLLAEMIITLLISEDREAISGRLKKMEKIFDELDIFL